jgi:hypothetical protein
MPHRSPALDLHLKLLCGLLAVLGVPLASFVVLTPLAALSVAVNGMPGGGDPAEGWILLILLPICMGLGLLGALQLAAAWGLWRGRRWGYLSALLASLVWCIGGLLPFGLYGLFALLRAEVRPRLSEPPQAPH